MSSANTSSEANRDDGCEWYFGVPFPSKRKAAAGKERELKVGDRVKIMVDRYRSLAGGGRMGKIREVLSHGFTVRLENSIDSFDWFFYPNELTLLPPTFTPNTRVRLIRNTQRYAVGDTGTVTLSSDESVGVHMDDGRYWSFKPEDLVVVPSPWATAPAPDCAGRNGEQEAKPKFKAGDVVGYKPGSIMGNSRYTIKCVKTEYSQGKPYDGPAAYDFTSEDGWETEDNLVLIAANAPATPCIVARVDNGRPRPSNYPHIHQSAADATKEAERLASVNPGKQFDVYQRVTGRVAEQHIEMKVA